MNEELIELQSEIRPERPIQNAQQDKLDRMSFVQRLGAALIRPDGLSTGAIVGLVGEWGSGKSSVLNLLEQNLQSRHGANIAIVRFDPWIITGRDDLIAAFFAETIRTLLEHRPRPYVYSYFGHQSLDNVIEAFVEYGAMLSPTLNLVKPGSGTFVNLIGSFLARVRRNRSSLSRQKEALRKALETLGMPIVVLIDELDRVEDVEIRLMAQLVRAVADFSQISYVLAYDDKRVVEALGSDAGINPTDRASRGRSYLEKVAQIQLRLPVILPDQLRKAFVDEVEVVFQSLSIAPTEGQRSRFKTLSDIIFDSQVISNLRDLQRVISSFRVHLAMVAGDVDWVDVLAVSIVEAKAPAVIAALKRYDRCNAVVFDSRHPGNLWKQVLEERVKKLDAYYQDIVPEGDRSEWMRSLFEFLFPALSGQRDADRCHPDEIAFYRPLVTLMRKSVLPGAVSRSEVIDFLRRSKSEQAASLSARYLNGSLEALLDRIDDIYSDNEVDELSFWTQLGEFFEHKLPDANSDHLQLRDLLRLASNMFRRQIRRSPRLGLAVGDVIAAMISGNQLLLASALLWGLHFEFGLYGKGQRKSGVALVQPELIAKLSEQVADLLAESIGTGRPFRTYFTPIPIYFLETLKRWTDSMRETLVQQLRNDENLFDHLVLLLFGGNYTSEKDGIETFMDASEFTQRAKSRRTVVINTDHDQILAAAYTKLNDEL